MKKGLFCFMLFIALFMHIELAVAGNLPDTLGPILVCVYPGWSYVSQKPNVDGEVWNEEKLNNNFPYEVLRDVTAVYKRWTTGEPINALGLLPNSGAILRYSPDFSDNSNIIQKLHASESVYVYFHIITDNDVEWYYVVNERGLEGYVFSSKVWLFY